VRFAIVRFPGTWSDVDCHHVVTEVLGQRADYVWHRETSLEGYDCVVLPGGFAHGDYLRTGAVARFSPVMGAVAGFLWWNAAPAKIFMGDTGSLAIGGLLAALAIVTSTQLLLLVLGGLFALITTSVIIQVVAFRFTGRRVFRMAPLHHHFELLGWPEFTVIVRFWILAGLAVAFGMGLFYADFLRLGGTA